MQALRLIHTWYPKNWLTVASAILIFIQALVSVNQFDFPKCLYICIFKYICICSFCHSYLALLF